MHRLRPVSSTLALFLVAAISPAAEETAAVTPTSEEAQAFRQRCEAWIAEAESKLAALEAFSGDATVESVVDPYDALLHLLYNSQVESQLFGRVHPDSQVRDVALECRQKIIAIDTDRSLSRPVFEALSAVDRGQVDSTTARFLEKELRDFRLSGVDRDAATRARVKQLRDEIVELGSTFDRNIAEDVRSIKVDSVEELAGMPQDWIDAHPPGEDGKIEINTTYPDYLPFRRYAASDPLRQALYFEYVNRGYPVNEPVLEQLLQKRFELAQILGFSSWAELATVDKMTGSAVEARNFVEGGRQAAQTRAAQDQSELLARLQAIDPQARQVQPWQSAYLGHLVRQEKYDFDVQELRPYFEYRRVRQGIFDLVSDLFGLTIQPIEAQTWHADVTSYELREGERLVGRFHLDMHPREGKYQHGAMFQYRAGQRDGELPESVLVCNFPGGGGEKGYLDQEQVETFLHEFGHLIHYLVSHHQRWIGLMTPEWDFIEAPSMMLEEWIYDPETLRRFAVDDAGEPIPVELVEKMKAARAFGEGLFVYAQMYLADLSLSLHDRDPASFEIQDLVQQVEQQYPLLPRVDGTHQYANFGHLNGYSAYYYTYMWSSVIGTDLFSRFEAEGLRNRETARDYLEKILAPGGSRPAAALVEDFLGRPYSFEAFQRRLAADAS